ncbi:MAG: diguanylate cyclase, partial [Acidobacteriia bacterium]|nr:diguanylate cyclase [Terriglobia bacterium]
MRNAPRRCSEHRVGVGRRGGGRPAARTPASRRRAAFNEKLDDALHCKAAEGCRVAMLMLDLDGFKAINDVH